MAAKKKISSVHLSWPRPDFSKVVKTHKDFVNNYNGAMLYAHYELTSSELKKEVVKYLKSIDSKHPLLDKIRDMHENRFASVGKYMYILNHKADVPDNIFPKLMPLLETIIEEDKKTQTSKPIESEKEQEPRVVISIQERILERTREVAGEIEGWIDDFILDRKTPLKTVEDFVNLFKANELKAPHMKVMQQKFTRRAEHAAEVAESKDKLLLEGYSNYSKSELKKLSQFYQNLLSATGMLQEAAKAVRAPRKKKPVSQDKIVSKLRYKKDDSTLGIVSINPIQILGSKEVWVYNTKTRRLSQYKAFDERGLLVKGTGIENYSSDSIEKTVRKPAETLAEFKKASKVKLRTFLKDLSTVDTPCGGRLNEHCVILRADK